jgi:hypothetical protein
VASDAQISAGEQAVTCGLCGDTHEDREAMGQHLANEHPEAWEMAVSIVALQLMGVGPE